MQIIYILIFTLFMIAFAIALLTMIFIYNYELLLAKVSRQISDGYVVFTSNGKITDYNNAFLKLFNLTSKEIRKKNILNIFSEKDFGKGTINRINSSCKKVITSNKKVKFDITRKNTNEIFHVEILSLMDNNMFMRYSIIVKDVTKTYEIIKGLRENQDMMANRERFATLGQLVSRNCSYIKISNIYNNRRIGAIRKFNK